MFLKKKMLQKLNNRGSSLVTVIVIIAFLTIITTTLLYMSGMNFHMKATDRSTKESFYEAETGLEELRSSIAAMVSVYAMESVEDVINNYANVDGEARNLLYRDAVNNNMIAAWTSLSAYIDTDGSIAYDYTNVLKTMVTSQYADSLIGGGYMEAVDGILYIRDVQYQYTDADGFTTIIETDFMIVAPDYSFGTDVSATTIPAGETVDTTEQSVNISECVVYCNWEKK